MAVRHGLGGEEESFESTEKADSSKPGKPENVDLLVSRFLDELSDLSSKITQDEKPAPDPSIMPEPVDNRSTTLARVPDAATPDPELEKINEEIEKSLAELESLRDGSASPKVSKVEQIQAKPIAAAEVPPAEVRVEPAPKIESNSSEPDWRRMELFQGSVSAQNQPRQFSLRWVLAGAVLVAALVIASYFFFSSGDEAPAGVVPAQKSEPSSAPLSSENTGTPAAKESSAKPDVLPNNSKSASQAKAAVQESKSRSAPVQTRGAETNAGRKTETANAKKELRSPAQNDNSGAPTEKPAAIEETPRVPSEQTTASIPIPVERPVPASNPPAIASQPKPSPVASNNNAGETAAPTTVTVPEVPPAAPKPATAATAEVSNNNPQPKPRVASMAEVLTRVAPVYPALARTQRISGTVEVEAEIDAKGNVIRAKAVSGPNLLRGSAEQALMQWKFKPASVEGVGVPSTAKISVNFNMK